MATLLALAGVVTRPVKISELGELPLARHINANPLNVTRSPLVFEPNAGQFENEVGFRARGDGYQAIFAAHEAEFEIKLKNTPQAFRVSFNNAQPVFPLGVNKLPGQSNYIFGTDPSRWRTGISQFERVSYAKLYPGVDLVFYGKGGQLEYDFIVEPQADPKVISLIVANVVHPRLDNGGNLYLQHSGGELQFHKPVAHQTINGNKQIIDSRFKLSANGEIGFELAPYNSDLELIIDPVISYSALLGGNSNDAGQALAIDAAGNTYVAGVTISDDFMTTPGAYRTALNGGDAFIAKINPTGTSLLYATYLGGTGSDRALGLAVDAAGNAYVTGATASPDFPITTGALRNSFVSGESFVVKLNSNGSSLLYSTYLGGSGNEIAYGLAVDGTGNAYVTGITSSANFPTTQNAVKRTIGGVFDAFITKINPAASALVYSTFIGGGGAETGFALSIDAAGNAYVAGSTGSTDFPVSANAYQRTFGGSTGLSDAFVAKLNNTGTALTYATYLGGSETDSAYGLAVDAAGNAYVTGETAQVSSGMNFPVTAGALQTTLGGGEPPNDAFVAKLNPSGSALVYSTYFGGNGTDKGVGIALDATNNAYVTGLTASTNLTAVADGLGVYGDNIDAFVMGLNPTGTALTYFTYLGGGSNDTGAAIALSNTGEIYVTGSTASAAFPVTPGTLRPRNGKVQEAFVTRIGVTGASPVASVSAASYAPQLAEESIVAAFGVRLATQTEVGGDTDQAIPGIQLPTTLAGTQLILRDSAGTERAAPLFFVSPGQINYKIPAGIATGTALVTVRSSDGAIALGNAQIVKVAPGVFTSNGNGQGVPAGFAIRVKADNSQSLEAIGELDGQNRWVPRPFDLGPSTDRVFLILFGTGWRFRNEGGVTVQIGSVNSQVEFAGAQGSLEGLDQANILLPRSLVGRGRVMVNLTANGVAANPVTLEFR
jgi:uncharacterized protein (TIGR03437 family)